MMAPSRSRRLRPSSASRWSSHTTYSSAVRLASVAARHTPFNWSPSHTEKTVLVLLALMASSMLSPSADRRKDVAGADAAPRGTVLEQQRAVLVEAGESSARLRTLKPHAD